MSDRRPRHLLDPDDLRRSHQRSQGSSESLGKVQRWVISVLAVTTILHLSAGLVIAAYFIDEGAVASRIGLCVIGGLFGVVAAAGGRLVHRKPIASWWLAVGFVPGLVGLVLLFAT